MYDQNILFKWFESPGNEKYRERLIKQFEQKMQNYLLFTYVNGCFKYLLSQGWQKINLQSAANRRKYTTLEFTGGATGGSVALRTSAAGGKLIKDSMINVTSQVVSRLKINF